MEVDRAVAAPDPVDDMKELDRLARNAVQAFLEYPGVLAALAEVQKPLDLDTIEVIALATSLAGGQLARFEGESWQAADMLYSEGDLPARAVPLVNAWPALRAVASELAASGAPLDPDWGGGLAVIAQLVALPISLDRPILEIVDDLEIPFTWTMSKAGSVTDTAHTSTQEAAAARRLTELVRPRILRPHRGAPGHGPPGRGKSAEIREGAAAAIAEQPSLTAGQLETEWTRQRKYQAASEGRVLWSGTVSAFRRASGWRKLDPPDPRALRRAFDHARKSRSPE